MTDEQNRLLVDFEVRVKQLMLRCDNLKAENMRLKEEMSQKNADITLANQLLEELKTRYDNLKIARTVTAASVDVETAKNRLSGLVREVDKCIHLLQA